MNDHPRIYTLTFQYPRNYGAILQAYALKKYLETNGCDVQVVDYWPPYAEKTFRVCSVFANKPSPANLLRMASVWISTRNFNRFKNRYLDLTKKCRTVADVEALPPADAFVVGSDQVWNPELLGEFNDVYFLNFRTDAIRASYAASAGQDSFSEKQLDTFAALLKDFDFLSAREDSFAEMLHAHGVPYVDDHLDPVFLLEREDYRKITSCRKEEPFILLYYLDPDGLAEKLALRLSKMKGGIPIYRIGNQKTRNGIIGLKHLPVEEFLGMIDHAEYIVGRSFHACALSIVFRKQFYSISAGSRSSRLCSLLKHLDLMDRFIADEAALEKLEIRDIDYSLHEEQIQRYIEKAKSYLAKIIDEANRRKNGFIQT